MPLKKVGHYFLLPTHINNQYAGQFLLDTGSALSGAELGVARRLELPRTGQATASGIGGQAAITSCQIDSFAVHHIQLDSSGRFFALNMLEFTSALEMPLGGIIGYTAFGNVPFTIDPRDPSLTIYNPETFQPPRDIRPFPLYHHRFLPMVSAEIGPGRGHDIWLVLDTGADNQLSLPSKCAESWPDILAVPFQGAAHATGIGGESASSLAWLHSLKVFGLDLRDVPVTFEPTIPSLDRHDRPVGRIGNELLKQFKLTFHRNRNQIWAEWLAVSGG